jgi:hypothetical protein
MPTIGPDDFANQCVTMALQFGINAHYLAAVAMLRSKLNDDVIKDKFGPYLWTQAEWNANPDRSNPALGGSFASDEITDWRAQVSVFALMAQRAYTALQATLSQNPCALELYQKQWPDALDPPLSSDLQKACDDTRQAILNEINNQLGGSTAAASVITSATKPVAAQSQTGGGGAGNNGNGNSAIGPNGQGPRAPAPPQNASRNISLPNGRGQPLTQQGLDNACRALGVSAAEVWAIVFTETDAPYGGFFGDGSPQILYEQHIFHRLTQGRFDQTNPDISSAKPGNYGASGRHQYDRLRAAMALDQSAALQSASWGMGQTLGANYQKLGYSTPQALVKDMFASEDFQLTAMAKEISGSGIAGSLASHDWKNFARVYNGKNYAINHYDEHLGSWYAKFETGALPDLTVRAAQTYLMFLGFNPSDLDGLWGPRTQSSLNQYQRSKQLPETSEIDDATLQQLANACNQQWAQPLDGLFN